MLAAPPNVKVIHLLGDAVGERHPRPERGLLSRPSLDQVMAWRGHVDEAMARLLAARSGLGELLALGLAGWLLRPMEEEAR